MIKIRKGLALPIAGSPDQSLISEKLPREVALLGADYWGMKPSMAVAEGDRVKAGQPLFSCKKTPGVVFTAPVAGRVTAIARGEQRVFQHLAITCEGDEAVEFERFAAADLPRLSSATVQQQLLSAGLWTALRTRPYSRLASPEAQPSALFVTAMDSHPLAADAARLIRLNHQAFCDGLTVLARLRDCPVYVCHQAGADVPKGQGTNLKYQDFSGPHPSGLVGTHIHLLNPVSAQRQVWHLGYQDVIAIGELFVKGRLSSERWVSLAGPSVKTPRIIKTLLGANLADLTADELLPGEHRVISGSVLGGRTAAGVNGYLGRYHHQVSVLAEGRDRPMLHYLRPGLDRFSVLPIYLSRLFGAKPLPFSTSTEGSARAMVPVGSYEKVMPLDILPTQLLRSLIVGDTEMAQKLGALELDEEDLALCTFVCPGKYEYGPLLRDNLTRLENEG